MSWLYTLVVSSLLFGSGIDTEPTPSVTNTDSMSISVATAFDETERIEKTFPLNSDGRISVSNINGSVHIKGWDRNEVQVVAIKVADTKERLNDVEVKFESSASSFSVETDYGDWRARGSNGGWKNSKLTVNYTIMAPHGAVLNEIETVNGTVSVADFSNMVKVSAVNGTVDAKNLKGTANLETVNGEVNADFERLETGTRISLSTVNGRVNLTLPSDVNATIKADSVNGVITNEFGLPVRKGKYVGRDLYGRIGSGDVQVRLESVNGGLTIRKKADGKTQNPVEDLLPQKDKDDESGDLEERNFAVNARKAAQAGKIAAVNAKIAAKVAVDVQAKLAIELSEAKLARVGAIAEKMSAETMAAIANTEAFDAQARRLDADMARLVSVGFAQSLPKFEKRSNSFPVKGRPDVIVDAENAAVRIIGWDQPEVKYNLITVANPRNASTVSVKEESSASKVELSISGSSPNGNSLGPVTWRSETRIEIYVPRRSNLKVMTSGEIRVEGVSGKLEIEGGEQSINLRDIEGELTVNSTDGSIRLVGFDGSVDAKSDCGMLSLEGEFTKIDARSDCGEVVLTLPSNTDASIDAIGGVVSFEGFAAKRDPNDENEQKYTLGNGGKVVTIETDGTVLVRSKESISTK